MRWHGQINSTRQQAQPRTTPDCGTALVLEGANGGRQPKYPRRRPGPCLGWGVQRQGGDHCGARQSVAHASHKIFGAGGGPLSRAAGALPRRSVCAWAFFSAWRLASGDPGSMAAAAAAAKAPRGSMTMRWHKAQGGLLPRLLPPTITCRTISVHCLRRSLPPGRGSAHAQPRSVTQSHTALQSALEG